VGLWGRIFAAGYDRVMAESERLTLRPHRAALLATASGRVLEIGGGTGANLAHYGDRVSELVITEPEEPMLRRLQRRSREGRIRPQLVTAAAEELPFDGESFDAAVSTLVLCTVTDQRRALGELHRVLRPGGRLVFIEHVRSDAPRLARWQDRLNWLQRRVGHGCNCNRATAEAITAAGFAIESLEHDQIAKAPPHVRPLIVGSATKNGRS
jgi:ubiquinone/menaquinone biosynthesis C-methylase UbiE